MTFEETCGPLQFRSVNAQVRAFVRIDLVRGDCFARMAETGAGEAEKTFGGDISGSWLTAQRPRSKR